MLFVRVLFVVDCVLKMSAFCSRFAFGGRLDLDGIGQIDIEREEISESEARCRNSRRAEETARGSEHYAEQCWSGRRKSWCRGKANGGRVSESLTCSEYEINRTGVCRLADGV